jgi:hypothetical protein
MSLMFVAAMMMAQAPAAVQPAPAPQTAKKQKAPQVCEYIELTGSRSKRRVCRDVNGDLDLGPGIRSGSVGQSKIEDRSPNTVNPGS